MPEVFQRINWIDILVIILLFRTSYIGAQSGLSNEIFRVIGVLLGLFFSMKYYSGISGGIIAFIDLPQGFVEGLVFFTLVALFILAMKLVAMGLTKVVKIVFSDNIDKWGGLVFGFFRGVVLLSLLFTLFGVAQLDYLVKSVEERSIAGNYIKQIASNVYQVITGISPEGLKVQEPPKENK